MVSTLREAEYFAESGVQDIIYGVGIAPAKLARVSTIRARGADLAIILDSLEQADAVAEHAHASGDALPTLIEVDADVDTHRRETGVTAATPEGIAATARRWPRSIPDTSP